MTKLRLDISMSLDGFVAGPDRTVEEPLGEGGMQLHEWVFGLATWMESHGVEGEGATGPDDDLIAEQIAAARRRPDGPADVQRRRGRLGGRPEWRTAGGATRRRSTCRSSSLTHHAREPLVLGDTTFVFVTDGVESALAQARAAAGEKDVAVAGGASVVQQCLRAGLLDELQLHIAPVLLGRGVRLFATASRRSWRSCAWSARRP